jgi:lipoyl-dependent peroxiredoxin
VDIETIVAHLKFDPGKMSRARDGQAPRPGKLITTTYEETSMATVRTADAHWEGSLFEGQGEVELVSSGTGSFEVTWASRAEEANGKTSPEELIAAAHSTCFSMALSNGLAQAGTPPTSVDTRAEVTFQPGKGITGSKLTVHAVVPGMTAEQFEAAAQDAKKNCPVSQALTGTTITLEATLDE